MLFCFSTYHLDVVAADKCDYSSYAYLGLKCPFCSSLVYLHGSSKRVVKDDIKGDREIPVRAHFAHAKVNPKLENQKELDKTLSCEARSQTRQGQDLIEKLRIEAKGQRSIIYNKYLWNLFAESRKITKAHIDTITADFGDRYCRESTKSVRSAIKKDDKSLTRLMAEMTADSQKSSAIKALEIIVDAKTAAQQVLKQSKYLAECDRLHHIRISEEILDFLGTSSGNYALEKIVKSTLYFIKTTTGQSDQAIKEYTPSELVKMVAGMVIGTHWITVINARSTINC